MREILGRCGVNEQPIAQRLLGTKINILQENLLAAIPIEAAIRLAAVAQSPRHARRTRELYSALSGPALTMN